MSRKSLYRTHVAFVVIQGEFVDGGDDPYKANIVWTKGNLQPYKQGVTTTLEPSGNVFKDWRILYVKKIPELVGAGGEYSVPQVMYFVYDNKWYKITSEQDWTLQGRGAKHYKIIAQKTGKPEGISLPQPVGKLAQNFETAVAELKQSTKLLGVRK